MATHTCRCCNTHLTKLSISQWEYFTADKHGKVYRASVCKTCNAVLTEYAKPLPEYPEDIIKHMEQHPSERHKAKLRVYKQGLWYYNGTKLVAQDNA